MATCTLRNIGLIDDDLPSKVMEEDVFMNNDVQMSMQKPVLPDRSL